MDNLNSELLIGSVAIIAALWLDRLLGEPSKYHPLIGFGQLANTLEKVLRGCKSLNEKSQGVLAWLLAVVPLTFATFVIVEVALQVSPLLAFLINCIVLYLSIGGRSLIEHADNIYRPLSQGDLDNARVAVSMIVSRNTETMNEKEITSSAIESVLENGNDAVFAPLLWFVLLGAPGAVLFRLANTLDAMWGYKNQRYLKFGYMSAKADDFLGWFPARLTAIVYAFQGRFMDGLTCWKNQAHECSSPNGGVVMTTGAGALGVRIGGPTYYDGVLKDKKPMGMGEPANWQVIPKANALVSKGSFGLSYIWLITLLGWSF
ncbi:adenosylcobinamide-phosphate synthase CbiB [Vibrio sonorensis]|uniref:adenosylcobinamide-phosphate synthase CbiB n=1 Tax=Vibrio sonorensis TaxID=1004316 RepID=UPI0008D909B3|nr:adenosylcobinamide-phosphate synthase CbiB [Vibrio sonorensis]